jgi:hypothetical protein
MSLKWSYGDSNPRLLACHSWAHRPSESKMVALRQVRPGQPSGWVWPEPSRSGCVVTWLVTGPRGAAGAGQAPRLAPPTGRADQGWRSKPHRDAQRGAHRTSTGPPAGLRSSSPPVKIRDHHLARGQTRGTPYRGSSGPRLNSSLDGDRHQPPIQALTCRSPNRRAFRKSHRAWLMTTDQPVMNWQHRRVRSSRLRICICDAGIGRRRHAGIPSRACRLGHILWCGSRHARVWP